MTFTWEERTAILASMAAVPYTVADLTAAVALLDQLKNQYERDPDILSVGELMAMDLSGLLWEQEQKRLGEGV